ncbi:MAG: AsmA family protein [Thiotrichales bacterium]
MPATLRIVKWVAVAASVVFVALVASLGFSLVTLDLDPFKPQLSAHVRAATGRELTVAGPVTWNLLPQPGLRVEGLSLGNPPGFAAAPFADLAAARFDLAWLPLLRREVAIRRLTFDDATIHLQRNADGQDNWRDLLAADFASPAPADAEAAPAAKGFAVRLRDIELRNARIEYVDHASGTRIDVEGLDLAAGTVRYRESRPASVAFSLRVGDAQARLRFKGEVSHNPRLQRVIVGGRVSGDFTLERDGLVLRSELNGRVSLVPRERRIQFSDLVANALVKAPGLAAEGVRVTQRGDFGIDLQRQTLEATALNTAVGNLSLAGQLRVVRLLDAPEISGVVNSNTFDVKALLAQLGMTVPLTRDAAALRRAEFGFDLRGDARQLTLAPLRLRLDATRVNGRVTLAELGRPALRFDLAGDDFELDRYLAPAAPRSVATTSAPSDASPLRFGAFDVEGALSLRGLRAHGLALSDLALNAKVKDGVVRIDPLTARAYQGQVRVVATVDPRGAQPIYTGHIELTGVRTEEPLNALIGDRLIAGSVELKAELSASGSDSDTLARSLDGSIEVRMGDGTFKAPKLARKIDEIRDFWRELDGQSPPREPLAEGLRFDALTASGRLAQGVLDNRDLRLRAARFQAEGEGKIDLAARRLDYTLAFARPDDDGTRRTRVPLGISGSFDEPTFSLKLEALLKSRAQEVLDQQEQALREELERQQQKLQQQLEQQTQQQRDALQQKLEDKGGALKKQLEDKLGDTLRDLLR